MGWGAVFHLVHHIIPVFAKRTESSSMVFNLAVALASLRASALSPRQTDLRLLFLAGTLYRPTFDTPPLQCGPDPAAVLQRVLTAATPILDDPPASLFD